MSEREVLVSITMSLHIIYIITLMVTAVVKSIGGERCLETAVVDVDQCRNGKNIQPFAWKTKDLCNQYRSFVFQANGCMFFPFLH